MSKPKNVCKRRERHPQLASNDASDRITDRAPWDGWSAQAQQLGLKGADSSCSKKKKKKKKTRREGKPR